MIRRFAEKGPATGYELDKEGTLSSSTWYKDVKPYLDSETGKHLIDLLDDLSGAKMPRKRKSKRRTDYYWVTPLGLSAAIGLGVDPKILQGWLTKLSIQDEESSYLVELAIAGGSEWTGNMFTDYFAESVLRGFLSLPEEESRREAVISVLKRFPTQARPFLESLVRQAEYTLFLIDEIQDETRPKLQPAQLLEIRRETERLERGFKQLTSRLPELVEKLEKAKREHTREMHEEKEKTQVLEKDLHSVLSEWHEFKRKTGFK